METPDQGGRQSKLQRTNLSEHILHRLSVGVTEAKEKNRSLI